MKMKIIAILLSWSILFTAAYAINGQAVQKMLDRATIPNIDSIHESFISEPTTTPSSGGSSGQGEGGGGVVMCTDFENIEKYERYERNLITDSPIVYTFSDPDLKIYEISVTGKNNENNVAIRVESLKGLSACAKNSSVNNVYKHVNVWSGSQDIRSMSIKFKVENSWINDNGDITLKGWDKYNKNWNSLNTTMITKNDNYTYFESIQNSMSMFAIVGSKTPSIILDGLIDTDIEDITPISTQGTLDTSKEDDTKKDTPGFGIMIGIIVMAGVYMLTRKWS